MSQEHLVIATQRWSSDAPVGYDKHSTEQHGTIHCRVFLDGREIECAVEAHPHFHGQDFVTVTLELAPASVEVRSCDQDEWENLDTAEWLQK